MSEQRPSIRLMYAWWLLLFALVTLVCLALSLLSLFSDILWKWSTAAVLAAFSVLFVWYLPAYCRRLRYRVTHEYVMAAGGVFNHNRRYLYIKNIQFAAVERSVIDTMFGLYAVRFRSAGSSLALYGLDEAALTHIKLLLPALFENENP